MNKQPRLGQIIYIADANFILKDKVIMKGKTSFAITGSFNTTFQEYYRRPIEYDDYGVIWFTKLKDAKESIDLDEDEIIMKIDDDYWEVCRKGDQ